MTRRRLRALQVEVTSRCTRSCRVCPRNALADRWRDGDLSEDLWNAVRPDLSLVEHLHLQGWGEPLLHGDLRRMVRDAHSAGCTVGVTTNGDLLARAGDWIVAEGVELATVSVAGLDRHDRRLRGGVGFHRTLASVASLVRRRGPRRRPRVQLALLLVRDTMNDVPGVVRLAAGAGADAVLVNHLDCTPTAELWRMAVFSDGEALRAAQAAFIEAAREARRQGIELRPPPLAPREMLTCDLDPRFVVSVRWDGRVAPCVHLNLPVDGPIPRVTDRGGTTIEPFSFGCLSNGSLSEVLDGDAYRRFTEPLRMRCEADRRFRMRSSAGSSWGSVAIRALDAADRELERTLADNPFPSSCRGCHKVVGW
jgi:MoaA/NifB/PqqE/SkfB family radical SAM enzyme